MKAALAVIFFACVASSMAADARVSILAPILEQGTAVAQTIITQLQETILAQLEAALGQLSALIGGIGGRFDLFNDLINNFKPILEQLAGQALGQILGSLSGLIGGSRIDISAIFSEFLASIQGSLTGLGQHFLNQGLAAVLDGIGSRGLGDIFGAISEQIGAAVTAAQGALTGALSGLSGLAGQIIDQSKPHLEQLQEQLLGHGLNVLGSLSETINNIHGSVTGGR